MGATEVHRRRKIDQEPGVDWLALIILVAMLFIGAGMIIGSEFLPEVAVSDGGKAVGARRDVLHGLLQHLGSAMVVAALMGLTYELLMDRRRSRNHALAIRETEGAVFRAIAGLTQFSAARLLELLQGVAQSIQLLPTLFSPARSGTECVFASNPQHFDYLIQSARADVVRVVDGWLRSDNPNLRFLAGDFVGKYGFTEFLPAMQDAAEEQWLRADWKDLPMPTKAWVLNFLWTVSAAEDNHLRRLGDMIGATTDPFTRLWLLHIPVQMPQIEGAAEFLDAYLSGGDAATAHGILPPAEAQAAIRALAAVEQEHRTRRSAERGPGIGLLKKHRARFAGHAGYVRRAWLGLELQADDLPAASMARGARVVSSDGGVVRLEDDEHNTLEIRLDAPLGTIPKVNERLDVMCVVDADHGAVPVYVEMAYGFTAPVIRIAKAAE
jgi:hypothetical protein